MDDEQPPADDHADDQPTQDSGPVGDDNPDAHYDLNPDDGQREERRGGPRRELLHRGSLLLGRGLTTAAVVVAAAAGAAAIAVIAGLLTLFGWGLAVVVALVAATAGAAVRRRPANAWLVVPALALAVPAVAVGISDVRVLPQRGPVIESPTSVSQIPDDGYRAGFGDLLVDLRELDIDPGDDVVIRAGSDLRRTVVALPQDQCFALDVRWKTGGLRLPRYLERPTVTGFRPGARLATWGQQGPGMRKRHALTSGRIAIFGRAYDHDQGRWVAPARESGVPKITLELESEGGSFVVRDFPENVAPLLDAGWPINQKPPPFPGATASLRRRISAQVRDLPQVAPAPAAAGDTTPSAASVPAPAAGSSPGHDPAPTTQATRPRPTTRTTPTTSVPVQPTRPTRASGAKGHAATAPTPAPTPETALPDSPPTKPGSSTRAQRPPATTPSGSPAVLDPRDVRFPLAVLDEQGRLGAQVAARNAREWRRATRKRQAFGREWAERVAGTCNPQGRLR